MGVTGVLGRLLLLLGLVAAAPAHRADAARCERAFCRCVPASVLGISGEELVHRRREYAARVVLGRVLRVDTLAPQLMGHGPDQMEVRGLAARVAVSRVWKGPSVDTLTVVSGTTGIASSCDITLKVGSSYVIFASPGDDGVMQTRQCTGTAAEADGAATIAALGAGQAPVK